MLSTVYYGPNMVKVNLSPYSSFNMALRGLGETFRNPHFFVRTFNPGKLPEINVRLNVEDSPPFESASKSEFAKPNIEQTVKEVPENINSMSELERAQHMKSPAVGEREYERMMDAKNEEDVEANVKEVHIAEPVIKEPSISAPKPPSVRSQKYKAKRKASTSSKKGKEDRFKVMKKST